MLPTCAPLPRRRNAAPEPRIAGTNQMRGERIYPGRGSIDGGTRGYSPGAGTNRRRDKRI
eukprot:4097743-Pyramimonas_sp.AAC.1